MGPILNFGIISGRGMIFQFGAGSTNGSGCSGVAGTSNSGPTQTWNFKSSGVSSNAFGPGLAIFTWRFSSFPWRLISTLTVRSGGVSSTSRCSCATLITRRLANAVAGEIASIIDQRRNFPGKDNEEWIFGTVGGFGEGQAVASVAAFHRVLRQGVEVVNSCQARLDAALFKPAEFKSDRFFEALPPHGCRPKFPAAGAQFFRGGAYKPRTSPYAFQGLGVEALRMMAEILEPRARELLYYVRESLRHGGVLEALGGFNRLKDYLAEDFVMGKFAAEAGHGVILSSFVIEHHIGSSPWRENTAHRLRWARSTRRSRPWGFPARS